MTPLSVVTVLEPNNVVIIILNVINQKILKENTQKDMCFVVCCCIFWPVNFCASSSKTTDVRLRFENLVNGWICVKNLLLKHFLLARQQRIENDDEGISCVILGDCCQSVFRELDWISLVTSRMHKVWKFQLKNYSKLALMTQLFCLWFINFKERLNEKKNASIICVWPLLYQKIKS